MKTIYDFIDPEPGEKQNQVETKICMHCKNTKPVYEFFKNRTGYDNRCIRCHGNRKKDVEKIKKLSTTPPMPETCQCCGRENPKKHNIIGRMGYNLNLDHYYDEKGNPFFRGWICKQCNSGIGYLGDTVSGVYKAFYYLLESLPEEQKLDVLRQIINVHTDEEKEIILEGHDYVKELLSEKNDG